MAKAYRPTSGERPVSGHPLLVKNTDKIKTEDAPWPPQGVVRSIYLEPDKRPELLAADPGLHNVLGEEVAWRDHPAAMDFLHPNSQYFYLKKLSTALYLALFDDHLSRLPSEATVLDAGCGIGRFTIEMARRFKHVTAFDPCRSSLVRCRQHLQEENLDNVELHWADMRWLDELPAESFDAVCAIELLCYLSDPAAGLKKLARVAKPGALFFLSVEANPGSLPLHRFDKPEQMLAAQRGDPILKSENYFTRLFDRDRWAALLQNAGLREAVIEGSHYFGEGPFWQSIDDARLSDAQYVEQIIQAETACRTNPVLKPWARVLSAVAAR